MDQRREFVSFAEQEGSNVSLLCRRYGISRQTGYKWLTRGRSGEGLLEELSRRPHYSPCRCGDQIEAAVLAVRDRHPAWGARKILAVLVRDGMTVPAASTVHAILLRHGRIVAPAGGARAGLRFEAQAPNCLWQMDFKGYVRLGDGTRCDPLTVVDDHSRYSLCLKACSNQRGTTVQQHLVETFGCYGLPQAIFVDNGSPWGNSARERWTWLGVWLLKLGVAVLHSRPFHPQSRGKNERFHRTLKAEVLAGAMPRDLPQAQRAFDQWRTVYNLERPHEALDQDVPASRYRPSTRALPQTLPMIEYDQNEIVRTVSRSKDYISFKGRLWKVPGAFSGERVAIRPTQCDGRYRICFGAHTIAKIDLDT